MDARVLRGIKSGVSNDSLESEETDQERCIKRFLGVRRDRRWDWFAAEERSPYTARRFVVGNRSRGSIKRNVSKSVQKSEQEPNKDGVKVPGDKECSLCFKTIKSVDKTYLIPCYHKKCLCEKMANEAGKGRESLCTKCLIMAMTGEKRKPVDLTKLDPAVHYIYTKNGHRSLLLDSSEGSSDGDSTPETVSPKLRKHVRGTVSLQTAN